MELKKSKEADLEGKSKVFRTIGLAMASGMVLMAFTMTSADVAEKVQVVQADNDREEDLVFDVPQEEPPPPPPAVAPPPVPDLEKIEIADEDEVIPEPDFSDMEDELPVEEEEEEEKIEDEPIADFAEVEPSFPGGEAEMAKFIQQNIEYPELAREMGEQGTVYVQFVVNSNGTIQDVVIVKGVSDLLDKEAMRVVKKMPAWTPGEQAGKKVRVRFTLPINFRIA